jgi:hemoglobin-like flavoprotein
MYCEGLTLNRSSVGPDQQAHPSEESFDESVTSQIGSGELCQGAPISEQAAVIFYDRLFEVAPAVKAMFPDDMTEQRKKLMGMLAAVVNGLTNLESILPAASALAKRHVGYGAKPEHYPVVGGALLWTLEKGLGEAWTPAVAAAWTAAYGTLSTFMISEAYGKAQAAE